MARLAFHPSSYVFWNMWPSQSIGSNTRVFSLQQRETIWDLGGSPTVKPALWLSLAIQPSRNSMLAGWFSQASLSRIPCLGSRTTSSLWPPVLEAENPYLITRVANVTGWLCIQQASKPKYTSRIPSCSQAPAWMPLSEARGNSYGFECNTFGNFEWHDSTHILCCYCTQGRISTASLNQAFYMIILTKGIGGDNT